MKSGIIESLGKEIPYKIIRRRGMRRMLLSISSRGELVMTVPKLAPSMFITSFLRQSSEWIEKNLYHIGTHQSTREEHEREYSARRSEARNIIERRVSELSSQHGFRYRKISIRNQRTRFGSCSRIGNLSFQYRIAFFAPEERDYIIIHELCHLRHFDHSPAFWAEVGSFIPEYERIRRQLRHRGTE
jgi:predicted metal-dependent hydrolase